ncbi:hypothetical protein [Gemmata algarum]|uniref:hypothetical protein n=1 Tax=Gemmata algarum TaxID=2975278 RepID=UPI002A74E238|nr:hypothetical protein [Gemmata algarum]
MAQDGENRGDTPLPLPDGTPPWITSELVSHTVALWSRYSPRPLKLEDAVDMLVQVGELYEVLGLSSPNTEEDRP